MVMEQQIRGASGSEVPVVKPEDAVPVVLPLGPIDRDEALLSPGTQEAVANHQVRKLVLTPIYGSFSRVSCVVDPVMDLRPAAVEHLVVATCCACRGMGTGGTGHGWIWVARVRLPIRTRARTSSPWRVRGGRLGTSRRRPGVDLDAWCYGCKRDGLRGDIFWRVFAGCLLGSATRRLASCIILVPIWSQISLCKAHINPL